jgi:predicted RNA binding protein YcfA (HicA-like mRNA interferase family)
VGKLPVVSGSDVVKAFSRAGWRVSRRHGSHVMMEKEGREEVLSIPQHREVKRGTLRTLLRAAQLKVDEFVELL